MKLNKMLASPMLSKAERARLRAAIETSKQPAEQISLKYRHHLEMQRREEAMMAEDPEERGPMAHEVTIISGECLSPQECGEIGECICSGVSVGVVEGDSIRVTARPAQQ
jgi:hypothetical protein